MARIDRDHIVGVDSSEANRTNRMSWTISAADRWQTLQRAASEQKVSRIRTGPPLTDQASYTGGQNDVLFATELILRRGPIVPIRIRIVPGSEENRTEADKERLLNFNVAVAAENLDLGGVIESAKECMGIDDDTKVFSSDILRIELSGPEQPHLTLVDLPGLFQAGSRSQSDADSDTVKSLVLRYMRSPRSIIRAVVSAKNDFNNQSITRYSREIDPSGVRTLGLITKPDTLDEGSDSESFYIELAQNREVKFKLGWHVLRNRDYTTRYSSLQERNRAEQLFFSSSAWRSLSSTQVGVASLKSRLSKILKDQILEQLPDVLSQIQDGICDCKKMLEVLGAPRYVHNSATDEKASLDWTIETIATYGLKLPFMHPQNRTRLF
ncbi:hypothetical protein BU25DRAFT_420083 [Macroventuria anomochaeta]|uniref:Uncharacterized protein n=1 Tax=Macroventuria anomochaeta TaxID=301207 RepID=A0ACB6S4M0_9PLEO|nr:uncharacterized protein BU25DRAFT_420083 [Macroventuria anomochaeta]KAF2629190.1 hypothetical protein BU25DRAFT_420083 [Macroventuria anomochaeta]